MTMLQVTGSVDLSAGTHPRVAPSVRQNRFNYRATREFNRLVSLKQRKEMLIDSVSPKLTNCRDDWV